MGKSIQVEIRATADEAQLSVMAGLEDLQEAQALEYRLDRTGSLGEAYAHISGEPAESAPQSPGHYYSANYTSAHGTFRIFHNVGRDGSTWRVYLDAIRDKYTNSCTY